MKIKLEQATTYVTADGITHVAGDVIDVEQETAEAMIRTGSASAAEGEERVYKTGRPS